jgi:probable blue pigment (indigoidine) exporter
MPAGAVSLIGLINPVVGTVLGVAVAGEAFGWIQAAGMVLVLGGVVAGQRSASGERANRKIGDESRHMSARSVEMCDAA